MLFGPKILKLGYLWSKFWKTNVRFEISTLEIGYMLYFVERVERWNVLAKNAQNWEFGFNILENKGQVWNQHLRNRVHAKFRWKISKLRLFGPKGLNLGIWARNSKKKKLVENSKFLQFQNFGSLCVVSQSFWVVLASFVSFRLVSDRFC